MERGSRKRSSSAGSEKMERVGGRWEKMEENCSTGQRPQWAVVPMEEGSYVDCLLARSGSILTSLADSQYNGMTNTNCCEYSIKTPDDGQ
jgi:hypothetical protein